MKIGQKFRLKEPFAKGQQILFVLEKIQGELILLLKLSPDSQEGNRVLVHSEQLRQYYELVIDND